MEVLRVFGLPTGRQAGEATEGSIFRTCPSPTSSAGKAASSTIPPIAADWLQEAVGVTADGKVGPRTVEAVTDYGRRDQGRRRRPLQAVILAKRLIFLGVLTSSSRF